MTDTTTTPPDERAEEPPVAERPSRRDRIATRLRDRHRGELLAWLGLVVVAAILRFWDLGSRPFHHDESQDAYFSYTFANDLGSFEYNPLLHGPMRFYMTAAIYKVLGDSDFTARLAPALMGIALVALPYLLRHRIGRVAAFGAGVILAVSPSILYFSRFAREDIYLAAVTVAFFVACFRFIHRPRILTLCAIFGLVSVAFAIKESGLVMAGLAALFFLVAGVAQSIRAADWREGEIVRAVRAVGWQGWLYALSTLIVVYAVLFTQFFTNSECMTTATEGNPARQTNCLLGVVYGLEYWTAQQDVGRGADKAWLYVSIIVGNEWPALLLALIGIGVALLRPTTLRLFLVWMFVATFAFHAWGSERFAWLIVHPLVPMILLAGIGLQALWALRSRGARTSAMVAVALGAAYLVGASYSANAKLGADPANLLVSTQSSTQVKEVADQVHALSRKAKAAGRPELSITIDSADGATFPYAWYFRDDQVGYIDMTQENYTPTTQVLVMTEGARDAQKPNLAAYEGRRFDFRVWWVKDYGKYMFSGSAWWDWLTKREPWNPTGGMKEWFYVRRDAGDLPGKGTKTEIPTPPPVS